MKRPRTRALIFSTFLTNCFSALLIVVAFSTQKWFTADDFTKDSPTNDGTGQANFGLFKGSSYTNDLVEVSTNYTIVCMEGKCMYSAGETKKERKSSLEEILNQNKTKKSISHPGKFSSRLHYKSGRLPGSIFLNILHQLMPRPVKNDDTGFRDGWTYASGGLDNEEWTNSKEYANFKIENVAVGGNEDNSEVYSSFLTKKIVKKEADNDNDKEKSKLSEVQYSRQEKLRDLIAPTQEIQQLFLDEFKQEFLIAIDRSFINGKKPFINHLHQAKETKIISSRQTRTVPPGGEDLITEAFWLCTIIFLALGLFFAIVGAVFAVINTATTPIEAITGVPGLYAWNILAALFTLLSVIFWAVEFHQNLSHNVLVEKDAGWTTEGYEHFGYSFWLVVVSIVVHVANCIIIYVGTYEPKIKTQYEAPEMKPGTSILY